MRQLSADIPVYSSLIIASLALVVVLNYIARRFAWIMPWYYLLPAILFLLTFTVFPVVLTLVLAFSNYAGIRNGELNVSSEAKVVAQVGNRLELENPAHLSCEKLLSFQALEQFQAGEDVASGCQNVRAVVYASGRAEVAGISLEEQTLRVSPAPDPTRKVTSVEVFLPDFGFAQAIKVIGQEGDSLQLERSPAGTADISTISMVLDREGEAVTILDLQGTTITLDRELSSDKDYVAIARYNDFGFVGWDNFRLILRQASRALGPVFLWNISFAMLTIVINTIFGVFIALLLNNPNLHFRNVYRTLLIVPWALPGIITIQVWRGFLNTNFGAINRFLALLDMPTLDWLGELYPARAAILLVNLWLGLPFMMTATLGALSAIPRELYEAARIDGANRWQGFWGVTAPLLRTALIPITLTGFAYNFNNFNIIFLLTDGGPPVGWGTATARGTDILISWAYNEAFRAQGGYAYGVGSAISILIFIVTLAVSLMNFKVTGALKEESNT